MGTWDWANVLVKETTEKYVNFTLGGDIYQVVEWSGVEWSGRDMARLNELSNEHNLPLGTVVFDATVHPVPPGSLR